MTTAAQYFNNLSNLFEVWRSFYAQNGTCVRNLKVAGSNPATKCTNTFWFSATCKIFFEYTVSTLSDELINNFTHCKLFLASPTVDLSYFACFHIENILCSITTFTNIYKWFVYVYCIFGMVSFLKQYTFSYFWIIIFTFYFTNYK